MEGQREGSIRPYPVFRSLFLLTWQRVICAASNDATNRSDRTRRWPLSGKSISQSVSASRNAKVGLFDFAPHCRKLSCPVHVYRILIPHEYVYAHSFTRQQGPVINSEQLSSTFYFISALRVDTPSNRARAGTLLQPLIGRRPRWKRRGSCDPPSHPDREKS